MLLHACPEGLGHGEESEVCVAGAHPSDDEDVLVDWAEATQHEGDDVDVALDDHHLLHRHSDLAQVAADEVRVALPHLSGDKLVPNHQDRCSPHDALLLVVHARDHFPALVLELPRREVHRRWIVLILNNSFLARRARDVFLRLRILGRFLVHVLRLLRQGQEVLISEASHLVLIQIFRSPVLLSVLHHGAGDQLRGDAALPVLELVVHRVIDGDTLILQLELVQRFEPLLAEIPPHPLMDLVQLFLQGNGRLNLHLLPPQERRIAKSIDHGADGGVALIVQRAVGDLSGTDKVPDISERPFEGRRESQQRRLFDLARERSGQTRVSFDPEHVDLGLELDPRQGGAEKDGSEVHEGEVRKVSASRIRSPAPHDHTPNARRLSQVDQPVDEVLGLADVNRPETVEVLVDGGLEHVLIGEVLLCRCAHVLDDLGELMLGVFEPDGLHVREAVGAMMPASLHDQVQHDTAVLTAVEGDGELTRLKHVQHSIDLT
mmetsp:Transcript_29189/g.93811  ORF Transcript_29189/g.93811 Transcript_29189/m.93811 type:complete len:491 (+) Transcript_29189:930-2402(+)